MAGHAQRETERFMAAQEHAMYEQGFKRFPVLPK